MNNDNKRKPVTGYYFEKTARAAMQIANEFPGITVIANEPNEHGIYLTIYNIREVSGLSDFWKRVYELAGEADE